MKRPLSAAAILVVGLVSFAQPASAEVSGAFRGVLIFRGSPGEVPGTGLFSGAFNAICTETATVTQGPGGTFEATDRFDCPQGSIFNRISGTADFRLDPRTCVARVPQSGTFTITGGTGEFAGASGGGTFTGEATSCSPGGPKDATSPNRRWSTSSSSGWPDPSMQEPIERAAYSGRRTPRRSSRLS